MEARLVRAVARVLHDQKRLVEEHLLRLGLADAVLVAALASVAVVPLEPLDACPLDHANRIWPSYAVRPGHDSHEDPG
jgi:hypothetical protein